MFVYVAVAPMDGVSLEPYKGVKVSIQKVKGLPGLFPIEGLEEPLLHCWSSGRRRGGRARGTLKHEGRTCIV